MRDRHSSNDSLLIKPGGILIVADIHIPSISHIADIIQQDVVWEFDEPLTTNAVFSHTDALLTLHKGDHWWSNRRRITPEMEFYLEDGKKARLLADRGAEVLG